MEILGEVVLQIVIGLLQLLGELLLQIAFEVAAEFIGRALLEPLRRPAPPNPWLAAVGYVLFGAAAGGASLWLFPDLFIRIEWLRWVNVLLVPFGAGGVMNAIGAWRRHRDMRVIRLDTFAYAYCFALAMALVRFAWGR